MKKKSRPKLEDDLRPEYDFHKLRVVARGPGRKKPAETTVQLAADVAEVFPDSAAEPYRDIDFSNARRGPVIKPDPGKAKISIRLDKRVIDHFRSIVEAAGGGNYQTLINDALVAYIEQQSVLEAVRQVVREEMSGAGTRPGPRRRPAKKAPSKTAERRTAAARQAS